VDDGSDDHTGNIASQNGAIVIRHFINCGQGAALETGDQLARQLEADVIIHFDADGQFSAEEIPGLVAPILAGECDVVLGSRFLNKKSQIPFLKKYLILRLAKIFNLIFFNIRYTDPQCGLRVFSRSAAKVLLIEQAGMSHCSEILLKIKKNKLIAKELPITVIYREYGQKFSGGLKIIKDLILSKLIQ
jgi:glycosyltransferase involved in cell wall biosynthesis